MPATIQYGSTSFVTTAPAATTAPSPICTPCKIIEFGPIQALSSILTLKSGELLQWNNGSLWSCCSVQILTFDDKFTLFPMIIIFLASNIALSPIILLFPI